MSSPYEPNASANPIHVVGVLTAKDLVAARYNALRPFHLALDESERTLRSLLPARRRGGATTAPGSRFVVSEESASFDAAQAEPHGSSGPAPSVPFELWSPWVTDVDGSDPLPA